MFFIGYVNAKSPHGQNFNLDCAICHVTENWKVIKKNGYNHDLTKFPLRGQHTTVDCRKCHTDLDFSKAKTDCNSCHTDVHQNTVGNDCARCHTTVSWIITNVKNLHNQSGFPLRGMHQTADCYRCHTSASSLKFENVRTDCFSCHKTEYNSTSGKSFDHKVLGFGTDCERCHNNNGVTWKTDGRGFDHSFFPLSGGHNLDCVECHKNGNYRVKLSSECTSCHGGKKTIASGTIPAHNTIFSRYSCNECHSNQTWNSVKFKQHDSYWGIYSGHHKGTWTKCTDCHMNDSQWDAKNTCSRCHGDRKHF